MKYKSLKVKDPLLGKPVKKKNPRKRVTIFEEPLQVPPPIVDTASPTIVQKPIIKEEQEVIVKSPQHFSDHLKYSYDIATENYENLSLTFILASALFFGYIGTSACMQDVQYFESTLSEDQMVVYSIIKNTRRNIFISGFIIALVLLVIYLVFKGDKLKTHSKFDTVSDSLFIVFFVPVAWYLLYPKRLNFIRDVAEDLDQVKEWNKVYLCMERKYYNGFITGVLIGLFINIILIMVFQYKRQKAGLY